MLAGALVWSVVLTALSTWTGCSKSPGDSESLPTLRGCYADDQCDAEEKCVFRLCSPACGDDGRCGSGGQCVETGRGLACIRVQDNACVDGSDCPQASECMRGRCTNLCRPDAGTSCESDDADASAGEGGSSAGAGGGGSGGSAGAPMACPAGSVQCRDNMVVRCASSGRAEPEQTCPFVCRDGACTGSCRPNDTRCNGQARERCDASGRWNVLETCRNMCTPGACTNTCTDGARECDGNNVTTCRGGRQFQIQRCDFVCRSGMCSGSCTPGSRQCRDNAVVSCNADGAWGAPTECLNACVDSACTGECAPGSQRCGSNSSYQICSNRGQWTGSIDCRSGACLDGECIGLCTPGATRCDGGTAVSTCNADGQWGAPLECPGQACSDGACSGGCMPNTRRCLPNDALQPQLCSAGGNWENDARCAAGQACVDGTCSGECIPTARRCDPGSPANYQVCDAGSSWGPPTPCGDAMRCTGDGVCETMLSCPPGQTPVWWGMGDGVNRNLYDPRWGGASDSFATGSEPSMAGYAIVYDRALNELAVTVHIDGSDEATSNDFVYFALSNSDGTVGRAVRIELAGTGMGMGMGSDPRTLMSVDGYQLAAGTWTESGRPAWVDRASGWVNTPDIAWAASFRVSLAETGLDPASPIRIAIGAHLDSGDTELNWTTPTQLPLDPLMTQPRFWSTVNLAELGCAARVVLQ